MQPATAIVAGVHYKGVAFTIFAQSLGIDLAETCGVHTTHMYITDLAAGEFLDTLLVVTHPALVIAFGIIPGRSDDYILLLAAGLDFEHDSLAVRTGQSLIPWSTCLHLLAVDGQDEITLLHIGSIPLEHAIRKEFLYLQALAGIFLIEDDAHVADSADRSAIAASGVGTVEFTKHFGKKFAECEIVRDIREELAVVRTHGSPIYSMHVSDIPFFLDLSPAMLEYVFALLDGIVFELAAETYVFS